MCALALDVHDARAFRALSTVEFHLAKKLQNGKATEGYAAAPGLLEMDWDAHHKRQQEASKQTKNLDQLGMANGRRRMSMVRLQSEDHTLAQEYAEFQRELEEEAWLLQADAVDACEAPLDEPHPFAASKPAPPPPPPPPLKLSMAGFRRTGSMVAPDMHFVLPPMRRDEDEEDDTLPGQSPGTSHSGVPMISPRNPGKLQRDNSMAPPTMMLALALRSARFSGIPPLDFTTLSDPSNMSTSTSPWGSGADAAAAAAAAESVGSTAPSPRFLSMASHRISAAAAAAAAEPSPGWGGAGLMTSEPSFRHPGGGSNGGPAGLNLMTAAPSAGGGGGGGGALSARYPRDAQSDAATFSDLLGYFKPLPNSKSRRSSLLISSTSNAGALAAAAAAAERDGVQHSTHSSTGMPSHRAPHKAPSRLTASSCHEVEQSPPSSSSIFGANAGGMGAPSRRSSIAEGDFTGHLAGILRGAGDSGQHGGGSPSQTGSLAPTRSGASMTSPRGNILSRRVSLMAGPMQGDWGVDVAAGASAAPSLRQSLPGGPGGHYSSSNTEVQQYGGGTIAAVQSSHGSSTGAGGHPSTLARLGSSAYGLSRDAGGATAVQQSHGSSTATGHPPSLARLASSAFVASPKSKPDGLGGWLNKVKGLWKPTPKATVPGSPK